MSLSIYSTKPSEPPITAGAAAPSSGHLLQMRAADANVLVTTCTGNGNTTRVGSGAAFELSSCLVEPYDASKPSAWRPEFATTGSAWYGPRFNYDPATGAALGILVEESRTNDISKSLNLTTSDTTGLAASIANSATTYLGGWSAVTVTGDGTSNSHGGYAGTITPGASQARSIQAIVKRNSGQYVQLTGSGNWLVDLNGYANFDLVNGTVTATGASASNAFIRPLGNNIYHIGMNVTSSASPTAGAACIVALINSGTDTRLPSNTSTASFDLIYNSNSLGTGWSSVIPTFGTAATKAADTMSIVTTGWINAALGTIFGKVFRLHQSPSGTITNIGNSGGTSERNQFRINGTVTSHIITVGGVVQSTSAISVATAAGAAKTAYQYAAGTQTICVNGTLTASAGNCPALPATKDTLHVGQLNSTTEKANFWIQELRYYPDNSASNAQLQTLTT